MIYQPKIVYAAGGGSTLNFSLSQKLWTYEEGAGMGGEDMSAAGVPVSYIVRWDQLLNVTLRFLESERAAVMDWLKWAQQNKSTSFSFYFDATDLAGAAYDVYLESPKVGERITMPREANSPWVMSTSVTLRQVTGVRIARNPYP
jgi:hypothetical protein